MTAHEAVNAPSMVLAAIGGVVAAADMAADEKLAAAAFLAALGRVMATDPAVAIRLRLAASNVLNEAA